ncbi:MAG TPA: ABC transporter ATP-binding protein [Candidatus Limnocylindrales bacterium]
MSGPTARPGGSAGGGMGPGARPGGVGFGPGRGRGPGGGGPMHMGMGMGMGAKSKNFGPSFRRLVGELRAESPKIALVIGLAVVSVVLSVIGPKILGNAMNVVFTGFLGNQIGHQFPQAAGLSHDQLLALANQTGNKTYIDMLNAYPDLLAGVGINFAKLTTILLTVAGIYIASAIFSWGQAYIMAGVTQRTVYRLRSQVSVKLGRLPLSYFDRESRGDILSRVTNDIDNISQTLQQSLTQLITSVLTVIGMLIMMLTISWELAAISVLVVPVTMVITVLIAKRSQVQFAAQWERTGTLNGHIEEMHTGHAIVKLFGRQTQAIEVFDGRNESLYDASWKAQFISGLIQPTMQFVSNLNYVAIAVIGGVRVATGTMTLGDVTAFISYSRQFTFPIIQAASIANVLQSAVASAERVFELLDEQEEIPDPVQPAVLKEPAEGYVTFEDVSFRYLPEKPLIEDLNLTVKPGQTVAIVGPTGAGKTTLVNLLMRFYDVDHGRITVDGIDTRTLTRDNLRKTFGMVLQDTWLFKGTIRENVTYGCDTDICEERFHEAVEAAHVDHFVKTLPDGYETVLDDDATNTSAGEKQLLTIARAFLADPPILILDEATSSVDTRTELLIQRAMARLMEGRTSFVIAHRLSTIRDADVILVMRDGRIVEKGSHAELLAAGGFYHELYASQFEEALDPVA